MAELYHIRNPGTSSEEGPLTEQEIRALIVSGSIALDARVRESAGGAFQPITHFTVFAAAFEERFGLDGLPHGSESTPSLTGQRKETPKEKSNDFFLEETLPLDDEAPLAVSLDDVETDHGLGEKPPEPDTDDLGSTTTVDRTPPESIPEPEVETPIPSGETEGPSTPTDEMQPQPRATIEEETTTDSEKTPIMLNAVKHDPMARTRTDHDASPAPIGKPPTISSIEKVEQGVELKPIVSPVLETHDELPQLEIQRQVPLSQDAMRILHLSVAFGAWAILLVLLYGSSIVLSLGKGEDRMPPLFFVRFFLLAGAGAGLVAFFWRDLSIRREDFALPPKWLLVALAFGVPFGYVIQAEPSGSKALAIVAAVSLCIAEEVFFRGYVSRVLGNAFAGVIIPTLIGAPLYGLYFLTFHLVWANGSPVEVAAWLGAMTIGAGAPYCLMYHLSKSLVPPFLCHLLVSILMFAT